MLMWAIRAIVGSTSMVRTCRRAMRPLCSPGSFAISGVSAMSAAFLRLISRPLPSLPKFSPLSAVTITSERSYGPLARSRSSTLPSSRSVNPTWSRWRW
jgi:hypothetical protein